MEFFDIAKTLSPALALLVIGMAYAIMKLWGKLSEKDRHIMEMFHKLEVLIAQNTAQIGKLDEVFKFFEHKITEK
jgi:hypothetical protein